MVQAENGKIYRHNRSHLKPICYDGTSFQDHSVKREKKDNKTNSFQVPQPKKGVIWVHNTKIRSNGLERNQLGTQYKIQVIQS